MIGISRRRFGQAAAAGTALLAAPAILRAQSAGRVVVIGGGAGGGTAAKYLKKDAPDLDVTLIEANPQYTTCFYSNLYVGGLRDFDSITHSYDGLAGHGVNVVNAFASGVDAAAKTVTLEDGSTVDYDKLVLAPGIDFKWDAIEGYDEAAAEIMPHAYKAGAQTRLLKEKVDAMRDGGTFVMVAPPNPFRCPPGPYERVCMIAKRFKESNPSAKIVILDAKDKHSKQALFQEAWANHYDGMVEWVPGDFGGKVAGVDASDMTITTEDGEVFEADAANVIPAQKAGLIAEIAGATDDSGWCPIDPHSMASTIVDDVYVIGDASIAGDMPKSGFSANSQAKVCAMAIRNALTGSDLFPARFRNTCWSTVAEEDTMKVGASYEATDEKIAKTEGFISEVGESADLRLQTREEADGWYASITADIFG
ncbi:MAG: NAD(P)/FAD-dependent oxidoreductase [Alphaproteobacteria bacterium]|nr:NAD(P)/FAD-dependent oxidoreductase [Alphaproteobacteria bacterium]